MAAFATPGLSLSLGHDQTLFFLKSEPLVILLFIPNAPTKILSERNVLYYLIQSFYFFPLFSVTTQQNSWD